MALFTLCAFADEAGSALDEQIAAMRDNGIPYLELRGVDGQNVADLTPAQARRVKERLDAAGLAVWSIGSPLGKIGVADPFAPHMEMFQRCLETAQITGAPCIRLFSFYIPEGEQPESCRDAVMERLSRFLEAAQGSGVRLCHENEKGIYGDNAARCLDILQNLPEMTGIFDPANFIQCGQDVPAAWELLAPRIHYLHIKDALADGSVVPAGKGKGHLADLVAAFGRQGGGVLTLEPHLQVFEGFDALEHGEKSAVGTAYTYPSGRAAFDAAAAALKALL